MQADCGECGGVDREQPRGKGMETEQPQHHYRCALQRMEDGGARRGLHRCGADGRTGFCGKTVRIQRCVQGSAGQGGYAVSGCTGGGMAEGPRNEAGGDQRKSGPAGGSNLPGVRIGGGTGYGAAMDDGGTGTGRGKGYMAEGGKDVGGRNLGVCQPEKTDRAA